MIDTIPYAIGFVIYVMFNILTFHVYSKDKEYVNHIVLYMIYIYYTILAGYVINLVESVNTQASFLETAGQILIYAIAGGLFMVYHFKKVIETDDKFADKEGSF